MVKNMINLKKIINYFLFLYIIFLPFEEALASSFGSIMKLFGMVIISASFIYLIINNEKKVKINIIIILIIFWFLFSGISIIWSESIQWWSYFMKIYLSQFLLFLSLSFLPDNIIDLSLMEKSFIISGLVAAVVLIVFPSGSHYTDEGRRTIIMFGNTLDPNVLSGVMSLGLFCAVKKIFNKQYILSSCIFTGLIFFGILLTGSRGGLIASVLPIIVGVFVYKKSLKDIPKLVFFIIVILIIGYFSLDLLPDELITNRFNFNILFGQNEIETGSHSRYKIWSYAIPLIYKKLFFGYGTGNFFTAIASVYRMAASHNMYILIAVESGIIGIFLFFLPIFILIRKLIKKNKITELMLMSSILILGLTLDSITYKYFWLGYIYIYLICKKELNE